MTRSRTSAKQAGTTFETLIATYFNETVDDRIERRTRGGSKDRGDIAGLRVHGKRIVVECKNVMKMALGPWAAEAEIERGNDDALCAVVIHKRHGKGKPEDQWVTLTVKDFAAIIAGERVGNE